MKRIIPIFMMLILALAACTGTPQTETNTEPTAVETVAQVQPTETSVPATDTPAPASLPTDEPVAETETSPAVEPGCYPDPISNLIDLTPN